MAKVFVGKPEMMGFVADMTRCATDLRASLVGLNLPNGNPAVRLADWSEEQARSLMERMWMHVEEPADTTAEGELARCVCGAVPKWETSGGNGGPGYYQCMHVGIYSAAVMAFDTAGSETEPVARRKWNMAFGRRESKAAA